MRPDITDIKDLLEEIHSHAENINDYTKTLEEDAEKLYEFIDCCRYLKLDNLNPDKQQENNEIVKNFKSQLEDLASLARDLCSSFQYEKYSGLTFDDQEVTKFKEEIDKLEKEEECRFINCLFPEKETQEETKSKRKGI